MPRSKPPTRKEAGLQPMDANIAPNPNSKKRARDDDSAAVPMDCDKMRQKLQDLMDSGEMKVTHLQHDLLVSSSTFYRFMSEEGPTDGMDNPTWRGACVFFSNRKSDAGVEDSTKKRKSNDGTATSAKNSSKTSAKGSSKQSSKENAGPPNVSDIHLDGEDKDKVPVYDTCDEIRRKIDAHLAKYNPTKAAFCRELANQYHTKTPSLQAAQLIRFRKCDGADHGNTNNVFYAAYVYFEKLRIKDGEDKTEHRQEMEKIWAKKGGFDVENLGPSSRSVFAFADEQPWVDDYGRLHIGDRVFT